jgi:hypothetical protein
MTGSHDRSERLQDYLDGLLGPAESAELEALLREDPGLARQRRELASVFDLLDTPLDVEPPADLVPRIFAALEADAARRFRLPVRLERGLVVAGASVLAGVVAVGGRVLAPIEPAGWIGRLIVGATSALDTLKDGIVSVGGSLGHLDWVARLASTLSGAGRTVLASSAEPLIGLTIVALGSAVLLAYWLMRSERVQGGGLHHVRLV